MTLVPLVRIVIALPAARKTSWIPILVSIDTNEGSKGFPQAEGRSVDSGTMSLSSFRYCARRTP